MENKNLHETAMILSPDTTDNPTTGGGNDTGGDGSTGNGDDPK